MSSYLESLRKSCPRDGLASNKVNLDPVTPNQFDNAYYRNLENHHGLLGSDQVLFSTNGSDMVNQFGNSQSQFFTSFARAIIKMGNISPLTGTSGQVRLNCRRVNA
ncbi:hypothetical protein QQ045_028715 [Rhodiola kirilowii]